MKGKARICVVQPPGMGQHKEDFMQDIATVTGATYLGREAALNLKQLKYEHFGFADKVIINAFTTTIMGGHGDPEVIAQKLAEVQTIREQSEDEFLEAKLDERIAKLKGHVGILQIKAPTDSEQEDMLLRIEDAVLATKSAISEGVVPGGGVALLECRLSYTATDGDAILNSACLYPFKQVIDNAGLNVRKVLKDIISRPDGWGIDTSSEYPCNMIASGIIDPTKVIREALENAVSISGMLLTTSCAMVYSNIKDDNVKDS